MEICAPYDIIIDGTDNFPTRYLVNDVCVLLKKPNVYGSIFRFEGQATVFATDGGPCYRCLYPEPPPLVWFRVALKAACSAFCPASIGLDAGDGSHQAHPGRGRDVERTAGAATTR